MRQERLDSGSRVSFTHETKAQRGAGVASAKACPLGPEKQREGQCSSG